MRNFLVILFTLLLTLHACREDDDKLDNQHPDTFFSIEEINLKGDARLNSIVRLTWYGTDADGYVKAYEISTDGLSWARTTVQDSIFRFSINAGSDTSDIELFVRSIDNDDAVDLTPDHLIIPIKNTAPVASFDEELSIPDTANIVVTTQWDANDIDGLESITQVLVSLNGKAWYELNRTKKVISFVPADAQATDTTEALVYYGTENNPQTERIQGLVLNDTNKIYIKAIDQAGVESKIDTSKAFYMKGKTHDVLVIGGVPAANADYANILDNGVNLDYDFLDLAVNNGQNQPKIWNVTFRLMLLQYSKLFLYSDETLYDNTFTNLKSFILEFAAASLQEFANLGGKYFISTSFNHNTNIDAFIGVLPISSVSAKNYGSARLWGSVRGDSALVSTIPNFPDLTTQFFAVSGVGAFNIDSSDTEILYEGQLSDGGNRNEWPDTKIVASGRRVNGKLNQVFFNVQLFELQGNSTNLTALFDQILNVEFN